MLGPSIVSREVDFRLHALYLNRLQREPQGIQKVVVPQGEVQQLLFQEEDAKEGLAEQDAGGGEDREQLVNQLHQELPYATAVETETWEDREDGSTVIRQQILVERDSQKAIVIGARGEQLKKISSAARRDMERLFDGKVYLEVWVKVRGGWADDERALRSLGYQ